MKISVSPNPFSPNGDGIRDSLSVSYELTEDADWAIVEVRDSVDSLVATLLDGLQQSGDTPHTLIWDGLKTPAAPVEDGDYVVRFAAGNSHGQADPQARLVRLDATTPVVRFTEVVPDPYSPDLPGTPDSLRVSVTVEYSQPGDLLYILWGPEGSALEDTLTVDPQFAGTGSYAAYWRDTGRDDGRYEIEASVADAAGNHTADRTTFSLDKQAPLVGVTEPEDGAAFKVLPDSLYGKAYDRSGVKSIEIKYDSGDFHPVTFTTLRDTVFWGVPLGDSLPAPGEHTVEVSATDGVGHTGSGGDLDGPSTLTVTRDSEPPPVPVLDPLPSMVRSATLQVMGRAPEADTVFVYLNDFEQPAVRIAAGVLGSFTATLTLRPGPNQVAASATDRAGNSSSLSPTTEVEFRQDFGIFYNERFRPGDSFEISLNEPAQEVTIMLYAMSGRLMRTLRADGPSTDFTISWNGSDHSGSSVNNGVYLCRVTARLQDGSELVDKSLVALVR